MSKRKTYFTDSKNVDCQIKRNPTINTQRKLTIKQKEKTYTLQTQGKLTIKERKQISWEAVIKVYC